MRQVEEIKLKWKFVASVEYYNEYLPLHILFYIFPYCVDSVLVCLHL